MKLFAESALLPEGWRRDVRFEIAADGSLAEVQASADAEGATRLAGPVLPGMPNLHSHAFQRAMAGLAERPGPQDDSFWTWREVMYGFLGRLDPAQIEAIAAQLYVEMLEAGYTAVGEFHYLHHDPQGRPYDDLAETSRRVLAAAGRTGIGITQLPVLYRHGDFGGAAAGPAQRRFLNDPERLLRLVESLASGRRDDPQVRIGVAPHSLRAVTEADLVALLEGLAGIDGEAPVHLHIAEQQKEVQDCIAWSGQRPLEWLLSRFEVDARWCLVHATHVTEEETRRLAETRAVAGLCPTTEANLGDGIFPARAFLEAGGRLGIGSDSHISVSPVEELRWLEYAQRLTARARNLLTRDGASLGGFLYRWALAGGAQALGRTIGRLAPGCRADLVVLDPNAPALLGKQEDLLLDALVFAGNVNPVRDVMVGGRWLVEQGRHRDRDAVFGSYRKTLKSLAA